MLHTEMGSHEKGYEGTRWQGGIVQADAPREELWIAWGLPDMQRCQR